MKTDSYFSKYYKGEPSAPLTFTEMETFFWGYEKDFYKANPHPTEKQFADWLENLLTDYLPNKMLTGFETRDYEAKAAADYRFAYQYGVKP